jgi:glucan phosphoethanolaminetransferase (alkaline phosphatase superfamily)
MTPEETVANLPAVLIILIAMRVIAVPFGILVFIIVRRISPMVTSVIISIFAGYIIGFVVLFTILWQLTGLAWYDSAAISLVVVAGIVTYISYVVKKSLFAHAVEQKDEQAFKIFGEPVKGNRRKNRRKHY